MREQAQFPAVTSRSKPHLGLAMGVLSVALGLVGQVSCGVLGSLVLGLGGALHLSSGVLHTLQKRSNPHVCSHLHLYKQSAKDIISIGSCASINASVCRLVV